MTEEFHTSNEEIGEVIAGFALGYFFFQVPGGLLASAFGTRVVLALMSITWSLATFLGTFAHSAEQLYYARVALGVAQAGLVPCCARSWRTGSRPARRGIVSSLVAGSMQLGAILATGLSAMLLGPVGWRPLCRFTPPPVSPGASPT